MLTREARKERSASIEKTTIETYAHCINYDEFELVNRNLSLSRVLMKFIRENDLESFEVEAYLEKLLNRTS